MSSKQPPFCPHLTQGQIVSFGLVGMLVPVGEAKVSGGADMTALGNSLKRPTSMGGTGGLDLSAMNKTLPVYKAELSQQYRAPEGADPKDPNPSLLPTAAVVPCQRAACEFWCKRHETCTEICNECKSEAFAQAFAQAFEQAFQSINKETVQAVAQGALREAAAVLSSGADDPGESDHDQRDSDV